MLSAGRAHLPLLVAADLVQENAGDADRLKNQDCNP